MHRRGWRQRVEYVDNDEYFQPVDVDPSAVSRLKRGQPDRTVVLTGGGGRQWDGSECGGAGDRPGCRNLVVALARASYQHESDIDALVAIRPLSVRISSRLAIVFHR